MNGIQMIEYKANTPAKCTAVEAPQTTVAPPTEPALTALVERQASMSPEMADVLKTAIFTGGICFISLLYFTQGQSVKISGSLNPFKFAMSFS